MKSMASSSEKDLAAAAAATMLRSIRQRCRYFNFDTGGHPQYHTPKDTSDLINVPA